MSRHISDERLEVIHLQLTDAIRKNPGVWIYDHKNNPICEGHDLICALDELRARRKKPGMGGSFRLGKTTQILMSMKVGEEIQMEEVTRSALATCRNTARKHLGIPDAVWRRTTLGKGLMAIRRMPNGSSPHDPYHNQAVFDMAKMRVGEVIIVKTLKGKMHNGIKLQAKRLMDNHHATWKCENMANGHVRVRRTA